MPAFRIVPPVSFALACALGLSACAQPQARAAQGSAAQAADGQPQDDASAASAPAGISGVIAHPAQAVPAMRICAISDKTVPAPAPDVCIGTRAGAHRYRLDGLRAGTYQIVARVGDSGVGGHVRPVQCIRAPCPEMLAEVALAPGEQREDVDLNGFYAERADFPALP